RGREGADRSWDAQSAALKESITGGRGLSAWALGLKGDPRAANGLKDALKDPNKSVRQKAAWALGMLLLKSGGAPIGLPDPDVDKESVLDDIANDGARSGIAGGVSGGVSKG